VIDATPLELPTACGSRIAASPAAAIGERDAGLGLAERGARVGDGDGERAARRVLHEEEDVVGVDDDGVASTGAATNVTAAPGRPICCLVSRAMSASFVGGSGVRGRHQLVAAGGHPLGWLHVVVPLGARELVDDTRITERFGIVNVDVVITVCALSAISWH
jgi:hypothetical protein